MKALLAAVVLAGVFCVQAWAAGPPTFIVDLDGTLVQTPVAGTRYAGERIVTIMVDGQAMPYRIVNGARELVVSLTKIPGARVYFFSGGTEDRNLALLKAIKTDDGRSLFDLATGVFSRQNLTGPKPDWGVKDVSRLIPDFDRNETVFIDDVKEFMAPGYQRNLINVPGHEDLVGHETQLRAASTEAKADAYFAKRNQLVAARGLIERARSLSTERGVSLVEALDVLGSSPSALDLAGNYRLGLAKLQDVNPAVSLVAVPRSGTLTRAAGEVASLDPACYRGITGLLHRVAAAFH